MGGGISNRFFTTIGSPACKDLIIQTQLLSTQPTVLVHISKGDVLNIHLLDRIGPCVASFKDEIAGTVIHKDMLQLINCLNNGKQFIGVVRSVSGGSCLVTIKPLNP